MPRRNDFSSILLIGSGPIVIGQACEFDYSGTQACKALKEEGFRVILVNSNPATIMTDPGLVDATYIEPIRLPVLERIISQERPDTLLPTMGGQTALNMAMKLDEAGILKKYGVELIGADIEAIQKAENRELFRASMEKLGIPMPLSHVVHSVAEALAVVEKIDYPLIIRPSFTLGGEGGGVANDQEELIVNYRAESLEIDASSESLVAELHRVFNSKAGKGFGSFKSDSEFQQSLHEFRSGEQSFYDFSQKSALRLKDELSKYPFADKGTLVLAEYQSLATDYLFIGLLPSNQSLKVTEGLDISATDYLHISKMDIVARLDLSTYDTDKESNRYLTYIKGRVGRKVADFFLDFLQAEVGLDAKQQNQVLMQAVEDFVSDSKLEKEEAINYKKQVADYCNEQLKAGDEVQVRQLGDTGADHAAKLRLCIAGSR